MKSDAERGEFGVWLRAERKARYENVPEAVRALQRQVHYGVAPSVWAELESGTRRPSAEQRERLTAFFGTAPEPVAPLSQSDAVLLAIEKQTDLLAKVWSGISDLVLLMERREQRAESEEHDRIVADVTRAVLAAAPALRELQERGEQPKSGTPQRSQR